MAKIKLNDTRLDQLDLTLTAHELHRLCRGDYIDHGHFVVPGINRVTIRNEAPKASQDFETMRHEIRRLRRESAKYQSSLWGMSRRLIPQLRRYGAICPTIGDSSARLFRLLTEIRRTSDGESRLPIIIADDGCGFTDDKRHVAQAFACGYLENHHEPGISGNLNSAIECLESQVEFVILLDDGAIPHRHWHPSLAMMLDGLPDDVVMVGCAHAQDWMLAAAGLLGDKWPLGDWCHRPGDLGDSMMWHFYDTFSNGHAIEMGHLWNESTQGQSPPNSEFTDYLRYNQAGGVPETDGLHPHERRCRECKYLLSGRWPQAKQPLIDCWSPGAQGLIVRRDFLESAGGFTHECSAYEQLLAVKAAEQGKRVCFWDGPSFVHFPSLGFIELQQQHAERAPMRSIADVCGELWGEPDPFRVIERFLKQGEPRGTP